MKRYVSCTSGRGSAWLERLVRDQEVGGSNPLAPTNPFNNLQAVDAKTAHPFAHPDTFAHVKRRCVYCGHGRQRDQGLRFRTL